MIVKRNAQAVLTLAANGDVLFAACFQEENLAEPVAAGELQVRAPDGRCVLASRQVADSANTTVTDLALRGRFSARAAFPPRPGLVVRAPDGTRVAELGAGGDLLAKGVDVTVLPNPGSQGAFAVDSYTYAAPNLNYGGLLAAPYADFAGFGAGPWQTRSIDLSGVYDAVSAVGWPFTIFDVPLNGLLRVPQGPGPFPLIVFAHGNHAALENSTPGYLYLCDLLASRGAIAATIDVNFLNQGLYGENAARALVQLEHVRQFRIWNERPGHPLFGKVDLSRVVIVGHSRGGEAVAIASMLNRMTSFRPTLRARPVPLDGSGVPPLGPYQFALRGLVAIAPTDDQYKPVTPLVQLRHASTVVDGADYLLLHGSRDADVVSFPGYRTYDRALPYDPADMRRPASGRKALHWIYRANHNYFNTAWGIDDQQQAASVMDPALQRSLACAVIGAWSQVQLFGRSSYWDFLRDPASAHARGWIATDVPVVSQYHDAQRLWIQTFDNSGLLEVTRPVTGRADDSNITAVHRYLAFPEPGDPEQDDARRYLYQQTGGLELRWQGAGEHYVVSGLDFHGDTGRFQVLSLRVGQSTEVDNAPDTDQDFSIRITDRSAASHTVQASTYGRLRYPDLISPTPLALPAYYDRKMVMQTIRIPLSVLQAHGVDVRAIARVALVCDLTATGALYLDDLQLSM